MLLTHSIMETYLVDQSKLIRGEEEGREQAHDNKNNYPEGFFTSL